MLCMCIKYLSFSTLNIDLFSLIAFVRFGFNTHTHNTTTEVNEELLTKRRLNIRKFFYYVQLRAVQLFSCALFFWPRELSYPCTNKHSHTHTQTHERETIQEEKNAQIIFWNATNVMSGVQFAAFRSSEHYVCMPNAMLGAQSPLPPPPPRDFSTIV